MSFALTTQQILTRTKTVTRRTGWTFLKPGDRIRAVRKAMGLKKGEKVEQLAVLRVVDVRQEPLQAMLDDVAYGFAEVAAEGFGNTPQLCCPDEWVPWFCATHRCEPSTAVTRIAFKYETAPPAGFEWRIAEDRQCDELAHGRRVVATVWDHGDSIVWHTWDRNGVGGENAEDATIDEAQREVYAALARQVKRAPESWWPIEGSQFPEVGR